MYSYEKVHSSRKINKNFTFPKFPALVICIIIGFLTRHTSERKSRDDFSSGIIASWIITSTIFRCDSLSAGWFEKTYLPRERSFRECLHHAMFLSGWDFFMRDAPPPRSPLSLNPFYSRFILLSVPPLSTTALAASVIM